jgi:hypothetical protein
MSDLEDALDGVMSLGFRIVAERGAILRRRLDEPVTDAEHYVLMGHFKDLELQWAVIASSFETTH